MKQQEAPPPFPKDAKLVNHQRATGFRFSLRTLLVCMTGLALLLSMQSFLPASLLLLGIGLIWYAATSVLLTGVLFARGDQRAFCVGAGVMFVSAWTRDGGRFLGGLVNVVEEVARSFGLPGMPIPLEAGLKYLVLVTLALANGLLCVYAKRYFDRSNPSSSDV